MDAKLEARVRKAVKFFWETRTKQSATSKGDGSAARGGKQIDGFIELTRELLVQDAGLPADAVMVRKRDVTLPGYYRPTKDWDLVAVLDGKLLAIVEFKSQVGSFGNNYNNRTEEAIGNAADIGAAYREGAFEDGPKPWMGYFFLLEDTQGSRSPVRIKSRHFPVFPEFEESSYADRYHILCQKLVRESLYDAACLLLSSREGGTATGAFVEPSEEVGFANFAASLVGRASAHLRYRG